MDNEPRIKDIVSGFIHMDAAEISTETAIDRTAVRSSIHIHRMYAALAEVGVIVANPGAIRTFGDLYKALGKKSDQASDAASLAMPDTVNVEAPPIGIDIEDIANFREAVDYREDQFYKQNFSPSEIAWCIMQPNPQESFAGKFAAKEAIVKSDNSFSVMPFNRIEILNSPSGKPQFKGFEISISHTASTAVAIAIRARSRPSNGVVVGIEGQRRDKWLWLFAVTTFLLAVVALVVD